MRLIKVDAIASTQTFLSDYVRIHKIGDPICVLAHTQTAGKGQRSSQWVAEAGKNATFSVFYPLTQFLSDNQFYISKVVAIATYEALRRYDIPKLSIKWPNDIMSGNNKIGGILIENSVKGKWIEGTCIGIGINVNQEKFINLPYASSLRNQTSQIFDIEEVCRTILQSLTAKLSLLEKQDWNAIDRSYHTVLYRKGKKTLFRMTSQQDLYGRIQKVLPNGRLVICIGQGLRDFGLKEIQMILPDKNQKEIH